MVTHIYFAPCKSSRRYAIGTVSKLQGHTVATGSTRGSTPQPPPPGEIIFLCVIICFFMVLGFDKGLAGSLYHTTHPRGSRPAAAGGTSKQGNDTTSQLHIEFFKVHPCVREAVSRCPTIPLFHNGNNHFTPTTQ